MINTEVEDFFSLLNSKMGKTDISTGKTSKPDDMALDNPDATLVV